MAQVAANGLVGCGGVVGSRPCVRACCCWVCVRVHGGVLVMCPADHPHSNYCYVNHKCRCEKCRAMRAEFARSWYQRMSPEERFEYNQRRRLGRKVDRQKYEFEPWQIEVALRVFGK